MKNQIVDVLSLAGEYFSQRPLDSLHSILNMTCEFLSLGAASGSGDHLQRIADVVIHESYYFQLFDNASALSSLVKQHEKASPDSD